MVNCSYCSKEIDRHVFCKPSHKVMFHKKGLPKVNKQVKELTNSKQVKELLTNSQPLTPLSKETGLESQPNASLCVHGKEKTHCTVAKCYNYASWR